MFVGSYGESCSELATTLLAEILQCCTGMFRRGAIPLTERGTSCKPLLIMHGRNYLGPVNTVPLEVFLACSSAK